LVTRSNNLHRSIAGFTLLELLVVLAIASALMALVPPLISAVVPGTKARVAALDMAASLRDARNIAITQSVPVDVRFDTEKATYTVAGAPAQELPRGMVLVLLDSSGYDNQARRAARFYTAPEEYTLRFYSDGSSNGVKARLGSEDSGYVLTVDWLLGRVSITEGRGDVS
jgi:general secretion pathway protein H